MTDTYYVHEFDQHDGTLPPEDSDKPFSEPEAICEADSLYQAISHAKTKAEERYGVGELHTTVCENGDILFFETGQPGGYRVRSTDDWQSYQPLEPEEEESEVAPFGERNGIGGQYAKARITVERETDGFSNLTEVFSFRFNEPELTQVECDPTPNVTFALVKGSQNGAMDFGEEVYGTSMVPLHTVPDSIQERVSSMLDWAEIAPEEEDG
jgi:hypothetical protein